MYSFICAEAVEVQKEQKEQKGVYVLTKAGKLFF